MLKFGREVLDPLLLLSRCFSWFISIASCCCCLAAAIVAAIVFPGGRAGRLKVPLSVDAAEPTNTKFLIIRNFCDGFKS